MSRGVSPTLVPRANRRRCPHLPPRSPPAPHAAVAHRVAAHAPPPSAAPTNAHWHGRRLLLAAVRVAVRVAVAVAVRVVVAVAACTALLEAAATSPRLRLPTTLSWPALPGPRQLRATRATRTLPSRRRPLIARTPLLIALRLSVLPSPTAARALAALVGTAATLLARCLWAAQPGVQLTRRQASAAMPAAVEAAATVEAGATVEAAATAVAAVEAMQAAAPCTALPPTAAQAGTR